MPANLKDLKSRIKSVMTTQQMTKAMKLVSAAKFTRAQQTLGATREYSQSYEASLADLLQLAFIKEDNPFFSGSPKQGFPVHLVLSSDRGLCGGYNGSLAKLVLKKTEDKDDKKSTFLFIGKKVFQTFIRKVDLKARDMEVKTVSVEEFCAHAKEILKPNKAILIQPQESSGAKLPLKVLEKFVKALHEVFLTEELSGLDVTFNKFQTAMSQIPTQTMLFPIQRPEHSEAGTFLTEGAPEDELLQEFIPLFLQQKLFWMMCEAQTSEHGSRMTAMDSATKNAKEMERKLNITYQRARQAAITKELIEIISGAEAL